MGGNFSIPANENAKTPDFTLWQVYVCTDNSTVRSSFQPILVCKGQCLKRSFPPSSQIFVKKKKKV